MIEREDKEWGVRLTVRPLRVNPAMQIQAEISNPTPRQNPQIRIVFSGVSVQKPFVLADALAWREAFDAMIGEAQSIVEELKGKRRKSGKRKQPASPRGRRRTKRASRES